MVRKSTRSAMKAAEKQKTDSPQRTRNKTSSRRRKSASKSDSEEDQPQIVKNVSPGHADKGSSDNESDTDSKKPLKKRSRSMAIKEETQSGNTSKSRWDKQPKSPPPKTNEDNDEEVKEDQNSKGKSKNKNNSNCDNVVIPETENANVQVTDESPSDAKDDNHETQTNNGDRNTELEADISNTSAEIASSQQSSEGHSEQTVEALVSQDNPSETVPQREIRSPSKEKTNNSLSRNRSPNARRSRERRSSERSKDSDKEHTEKGDRKSRDRRSSERSTSETTEITSVNKSTEKTEDTKKIKLKRPSGDKHASESDDKDEKREENGTKKKITLKRPDMKQVSLDESKVPVDLLPKEQTEGEWASRYEANNSGEAHHEDKQEKVEEKPRRKRITLKRTTVEDTKTSTTEKNVSFTIDKKDISLERSFSLPEHTEKIRSTTPDRKKRRSSALERSASESEEKPQIPKKPTKVVKLKRFISQEPQEPPPPGEEAVKKFRWGNSDISYPEVDILNLETLKQICPSIELLKEEEVNLDVEIERKINKQERRKTFTELEEEEMQKIEAELNEEPEEIEIKENIIAMNRKISIVDDTASKMRPPPSPARNPVSEVLFITNLVRPFTVKQLKELLERTGKIREDGFWTDRIKSKCYVYYETAEEAEATRNALHGVNWPIGNGKKLIIDYATVEDLENAKNPPPIVTKKEKSPEKENKKPVIEDDKDNKKSNRIVKREWDLGKEDHHRRRSRSRSRERQRKHSRRSYTPEDYHGKRKKHEEPAPQKAMDDLFLKTKATPSIYWQPLSPEVIAQKQQQRQARLEENKRRLEELSRTSARATHRDRGRDRNFRRR